MSRIRARLGSIAAILLALQVASAAVSSLNACCDEDRRPDGASSCCPGAGAGHMCPLMRGQQTVPVPSGELSATCANGHDEGVPRGIAPAVIVQAIELTVEWPASAVAERRADPIWRPVASPSPPPRA